MEAFGICNQSLVAVRKQPADNLEMVNQLIFGDLFEIKAKINSWLLIESIHDGYEGWVDSKQVRQLTEADYRLLSNSEKVLTASISGTANFDYVKGSLHLTMGSRLYQINQNTFDNMDGVALFGGNVNQSTGKSTGEQIANSAVQYLHAPYLWGGRSAWGIDCSGLVQMCFILNGIELPRDAGEQAQKGELIDFIHETKAGDLAFFDNEEGKIIHVGIVMTNHSIIHASGKVRIDSLDHQGIYQSENQSYSHKLRLIKRIII